MASLWQRVCSHPILARVMPLGSVLVLTSLGGALGGHSPYWLYLSKVILGTWLLWETRKALPELQWAFSWDAVAVGILVFVLWVGLDGYYPKIPLLAGSHSAWNPFVAFADNTALAWGFVVVRILGSSLLVPMLEEVFYRSFLYRYLDLDRSDFLSIPLGAFRLAPFVITAVIFGFAHAEWLPGILCGVLYQGLVCRKNRLGDAITAHAITNFLLGLWVVGKGAWQFW
jgi:CAAX prenyl protease-like protein